MTRHSASDRPDVSQAARGGKGFLRSRSAPSGPGGSPGGAHESDGGYLIRMNVYSSASTHTLLSGLIPSSFLPASSRTPPGAQRCHLPDIYASWQVISATSHSDKTSQTFLPGLIRLGRIPSLIIIYLRSGKLGKGRWACPDMEAAERGILPSGPHWDQHNASA